MLSNIANEIKKQAREEHGLDWTMSFNPGSITTGRRRLRNVDGSNQPGALNVPLVQTKFKRVDFIDRGDSVVVIGWNGENEDPEIGLVVSSTTWQPTEQPMFEFTSADVPLRIDEEISVYRTGAIPLASGIAIYKLWSVLGSFYTGRSGGFDDDRYGRITWLEWFILNDSGGILKHYKRGRIRELAFPSEIGPALNRSAAIELISSDDDLNLPILSENEPTLYDNMEYNDGRYYTWDGVPYFSGDLALDRIQHEFSDAKATDLLVEICKLTNSVLWIDNNRVIHIRGRGQYGTVREVQNVRSTTLRTYDRVGLDKPTLSSSIVFNESHLAVLRDYYADAYYPQIENEWTLVCEEDEAAALSLGDGLRFPAIGFEYNVTPAVIRSVEIRSGMGIVIATRAA